MPKYDVHLFPILRVKIVDIEAASQVEAIQKAAAQWNSFSNEPPSIEHVEAAEYAEEISYFLVDDVGDEEHQNSQFYEADGKTPLADPRLVIEVVAGMISNIVSSTSKLTEVVVLDYDIDGTPPIELREGPDGRKCRCYRDSVPVDPKYVEECFAALDYVPGTAGVVKRKAGVCP